MCFGLPKQMLKLMDKKKLFHYFSIKINVVVTQKNSFNEAVEIDG